MPTTWITRLIMLFIALSVTGCAAAPTAQVPAATAPPASEAEPANQTNAPSAAQAQAGAAMTVTELSFAGNGDTFLEHIAAVKNRADQLNAHHFVEWRDSRGVQWQGEALDLADETVILLQPARSGGDSGVDVRGPSAENWQAALESAELMPTDDMQRPEPEIRFVRARQTENGIWSVDVTLAYPDSGWEDYADGWHVATPDGAILATRILLHPHENEQPFTRGQGNIAVPPAVDAIVVRAHTLVGGYGQETVTVPLTESSATAEYEVIR